jgi:hypothetical protein
LPLHSLAFIRDFKISQVKRPAAFPVNPACRDPGIDLCATCGDAVLLHFMASVKHSEFPYGFLDVRCLDGAEWVEVEATREQMARGEYDEAYYCLAALAGFPNNFPAAYRRLLQDSFESSIVAIQRLSVSSRRA